MRRRAEPTSFWERFSRCLGWLVTQSERGSAAIGFVPTIRTCTEPTSASAPMPMSQLEGGGVLRPERTSPWRKVLHRSSA